MPVSKWQPTDGATTHSGQTITSDMDFFEAPHPSIGTVISAESTLKTSDRSMPSSRRIQFISFGAAAAGVLIYAVFNATDVGLTGGPIVVLLLAAAIVGTIIYFFTRFGHRCSYVGERGVVEYRLKGTRSGKPTSEMHLFSETADLFTSATRNYYNGIYTGTNYLFRWVDGGSQVFKLNGVYRSQKGWPKEGDRWHFANAAEGAWSGFRVKSLTASLEQTGYVEFPLKGNPKAVRIGSGFMEFLLKDESTQRVEVKDMKKISLGQGFFKFAHQDARWWSGKGKFSFSYAGLPNAKLFLYCLKQLTGIHWS
ncbi:MAG: hypothetical protein AAF268_11775 [Cyanobacteria bacterium P01_A01_bin.3]